MIDYGVYLVIEYCKERYRGRSIAGVANSGGGLESVKGDQYCKESNWE